ncbi:DUF4056 domain-containing protein [Cellvibrio sp. UBA7661]|uniref:DUF4056 domain-containing protein n=1 Tax=Cellvibrio sp. UBA7661 TaxID=1946311 RepID=UPI002F360DB4
MDIIDGAQASGRKYGLIYTKKCGWIDLGHANPESALGLWNQIINEKDSSAALEGYFRVTYKQLMGRPYFKVGITKRYDIKKGLSIADKKSIALSIFMDVSHSFETLQSDWPFKKFTNSGYSAEDLVSNLIGFYRAVEPSGQHIQLCEPVNKRIALEIWDKYGAVGDMKNYTTVPYVYPIPPVAGGPMSAELPYALTTIKPAKEGIYYREAK